MNFNKKKYLEALRNNTNLAAKHERSKTQTHSRIKMRKRKKFF